MATIDEKLAFACKPGMPFPGWGKRPEVLEYIIYYNPELKYLYAGEIEQLRKKKRKRK